MRMKVFTSVFFGKAKLIILYIFFLSVFIYLILTQIITLFNESEVMEIPDIEITGELIGNESIDYEMYEGLGGLKEELSYVMDNGDRLYGVIARNLFTFSDPSYHVSFCIYGVEDSYFDEFRNNLIFGHIPDQGKKEAVIGSNVATYYQLKVGDIIKEPVTLAAEGVSPLEDLYTVSGIIGDDDIYFSNGIYISKETFAELEEGMEDNMFLLYTANKRSYKKITNNLSVLKKTFPIGKYNYYYKTKAAVRINPIRNMAFTFALSILIMGLLFFYITKRITKQVSLLKALGISNMYITSTFGLGFGGIIIVTCLINFIIAMIVFDTDILLFLSTIFIAGIIMFFVMYIGVIIVCQKILPDESMLSQ